MARNSCVNAAFTECPKEESFKYYPDNASLTTFEIENSHFKSKVVNDTTHLTKPCSEVSLSFLRQSERYFPFSNPSLCIP
jgi:hypothetical protein